MSFYATCYPKDDVDAMFPSIFHELAGRKPNMTLRGMHDCDEFFTNDSLQAHIGSEMPFPPFKEFMGVHYASNHHQRIHFLFDFDLPDYNRQCGCKSHALCEYCYVFLQIAVFVTDKAMAVHFGVDDILWCFSGGKGFHGWWLSTDSLRLDAPSCRNIAELVKNFAYADDECKVYLLEKFSAIAHLYPGITTEEQILRLCAPKIDTAVSNSQLRIHKLPFVIHASTHRLAAPLLRAEIDDFEQFRILYNTTLADEYELREAISQRRHLLHPYATQDAFQHSKTLENAFRKNVQ